MNKTIQSESETGSKTNLITPDTTLWRRVETRRLSAAALNILKSKISKIYIPLRNNRQKFNKTPKAKIEIRK